MFLTTVGTDPRTRELVSLATLSDRYDLPLSTLSMRYRSGKRGAALVEPPHSARARAAKKAASSAARRRVSPHSPAERRQRAEAILATSPGRLAGCLFRDFAA
ncbi:hypothetical protein [Halomonas cerina]|uniref:Uncharacterized protein n=1 Tax=Halomonas cerina TaxID=447424 RepID=A0A839VDF4_9GAMM|nr:hypothetical protein [Halomonas cerina]MBB3192085.1 hypothetical protein [Halomonas cerina]